jgi:hypothetical protein
VVTARLISQSRVGDGGLERAFRLYSATRTHEGADNTYKVRAAGRSRAEFSVGSGVSGHVHHGSCIDACISLAQRCDFQLGITKWRCFGQHNYASVCSPQISTPDSKCDKDDGSMDSNSAG